MTYIIILSIDLQVTGGEGEQIYSPQQITGMMLTYLKKVAEKSLGKPVVDCVISVSLVVLYKFDGLYVQGGEGK